MTFFEGVLAILGSIAFIVAVIYIGLSVLSKNEEINKLPFFIQVAIALIIGGVIVYFILQIAKSFHEVRDIDFIILGLSGI